MSQRLISRSPDLKRLRDDGYEVEVRDGHLVIDHVPYVTAEREIAYGRLVCPLALAGDVTTRPADHVVTFAGSAPCDHNGEVLSRIVIGSGRQHLAEGLDVDHTFSSKPPAGYDNYYDKITTYVAILSAPAGAIDADATARTFRVVAGGDNDSPFKYLDTASSRAGIGAINDKLRVGKVAIVGLGGTGSYVLDLLAKTPIGEIHLFDGDVLLQHNAFRSPGAPSIEELRETPNKAVFWRDRYATLRSGIVAHAEHVEETNVQSMREMDFVFLTLDDGVARELIVDHLEEWEISFTDVGMGIFVANDALGGQVRVTTSTPHQRDHVRDKARIPFGPADPDNQYRHNIQIADLNMLNAAAAVIRWKKLMGFYLDLEHEHHSVYVVDGNALVNEDQS